MPDEVAVFHAFRRLLGRGRTQYVVIDTAPTGHTLLLLDVTGAFHRQVMQGRRHGRPRHHTAHASAGPDYSRLIS